ncbi:unnamed protein product, partial [Hapterophycus canaliculatus]
LPTCSRSRFLLFSPLLWSPIRAVSFQVMGVSLIYLIMAASCALFAAMCLETYGLRVREMNATLFDEKMNLRGR